MKGIIYIYITCRYKYCSHRAPFTLSYITVCTPTSYDWENNNRDNAFIQLLFQYRRKSITWYLCICFDMLLIEM